jgi:hypothetical protein
MLLLLLSVVALVSIAPWAAKTTGPDLEVPSLGDAGIGEATAVAPGPGAAGAGAAVGAARAVPVAAVAGDAGPEHSARVAIGPGLPVVVSEPVAATPPHATPPEQPQAPEAAPQPVPAPLSPPAAAPAPETQFVADFEDRDGDRISRRVVAGAEGDGKDGVFQAGEGDEYAFAFSFFIETMAYGEPGVENLLLRFRSDTGEHLMLGLELWEPGERGLAGERGLWASGEAAGGDRFLAPVSEGEWHDVVVHFRASSGVDGFYAVYIDGALADARQGVSLIAPGSALTQIDVGLFRDEQRLQGTSEIRLDAVRLGDTLESVLP